MFNGEKIFTFMRDLNRQGNQRQYGEKPMKLKDLSLITGIEYQTLWGIANTGKNGGIRKSSPNVEQAVKIAWALKKRLEDFMGEEKR